MAEFLVTGEIVARVHKVVEARTAESATRKALSATMNELWWFNDVQPESRSVKVIEVTEMPTARKGLDACEI